MPSSPGSSHRDPAAPGGNGVQTAEEEARRPADEPENRADEHSSGPSTADLQAEIARLDDRYRRALADLDNFRKRSARDLERRIQEARDGLLREWLEALDSVERAARMNSGGQLAEGMRALLDQMEAILARHGVRRIGAAGERFDPERHEAVDVRVTEDVPDRTILEVVRAGFAIGDRVLRPAQVVVSRRPPSGS
jgi:molecular chaperone GrpE